MNMDAGVGKLAKRNTTQESGSESAKDEAS